MNNYLYDIFGDHILSLLMKQYGTKLNDKQREDKAYEIISQLKAENSFTVESTQSLISKKGFNEVMNENIGGKPVYALTKTGLFKKVKCCFFISRTKEMIDKEHLEKIYDELRRQANGENVFGSSDYKNG